MEFIYNDGGRKNYFKAEMVGDCVCRAIAIATNNDYKVVYDTIKQLTKENPRNGLSKKACVKICEYYGGKWTPTMKIGSGCKVHLRENELPNGILVCSLSVHYTCVVNKVINDTYNPSRGGNRCVYGYWQF